MASWRGVRRRERGLLMFRFRTRVVTADLDPAGIVWYGNFLRFVEAAEDDLLRAGGLSKYRIQVSHKIVLTRAEFSCTFRSPAHPDDQLDILLSVSENTTMHVRCHFNVRHVPSERLIASGNFQAVCVEPRTFSRVPLPPPVRAVYEGASASGGLHHA
jgi:acyl-CoA thioester hydrolase